MTGLQPIQFESCSSVKAQSRYTEACLLLMHNSFTRRAVTQAHQVFIAGANSYFKYFVIGFEEAETWLM